MGGGVTKIVRVMAGVLLVIIGIIGIILPIMPGWSLLIPGLLLLEEQIPPIARLFNWIEHRLSRIQHHRARKHCQWCAEALARVRRKAASRPATDPSV